MRSVQNVSLIPGRKRLNLRTFFWNGSPIRFDCWQGNPQNCRANSQKINIIVFCWILMLKRDYISDESAISPDLIILFAEFWNVAQKVSCSCMICGVSKYTLTCVYLVTSVQDVPKVSKVEQIGSVVLIKLKKTTSVMRCDGRIVQRTNPTIINSSDLRQG